jgi:hypothetical protein
LLERRRNLHREHRDRAPQRAKYSRRRRASIPAFLRALDEKGIRSKDFVAITHTDIRMFADQV